MIKRGILYVILLSLCGGGYYYVDSTLKGQHRAEQFLQNDINSLNGKITSLLSKSKEFAESYKLWKKLFKTDQKQEGLKISQVQSLLNLFKERYKLTEMSVDLSTPKNLEDIYKTDTAVVQSSEVSLKFAGLSDEYLLSFVGAIKNKFPGYVKIKALKLNRVGKIDKETLLKISRGAAPSLVSGELEFYWRDLKDISQEENNEEGEG